MRVVRTVSEQVKECGWGGKSRMMEVGKWDGRRNILSGPHELFKPFRYGTGSTASYYIIREEK